MGEWARGGNAEWSRAGRQRTSHWPARRRSIVTCDTSRWHLRRVGEGGKSPSAGWRIASSQVHPSARRAREADYAGSVSPHIGFIAAAARVNVSSLRVVDMQDSLNIGAC
jgi:hypothetical protein